MKNKFKKSIIARQIVSIALILSLLFPYIPVSAFNIGSSAINDITFTKLHNRFDVSGGVITISGSNLKTIDLEFYIHNGSTYIAPSDTPQKAESTITYTLNQSETTSFTGLVRIKGVVYNLFDSITMPTISSINKSTVTEGGDTTLTLSGDNLNSSGATFSYFKGTNIKPISAGSTPNSLTFSAATSSYGTQNIKVRTTHGSTTISDFKRNIEYVYNNAFSFLKPFELTDVSVVPNSASPGDRVRINATGIDSTKNYEVYFFDPTDTDFSFADYKKATDLQFAVDNKSFSVKLPKNEQFKTGKKRLILVERQSGEIVSRYSTELPFYVIEDGMQPVITYVNPNFGSEDGSSIQIVGKNLISLKVPDLTVPSMSNSTIQSSSLSSDGYTLTLNYDVSNIKYNDAAVTSVKREITGLINAKLSFESVSGKYFNILDGSDYINVKTGTNVDVLTNPTKDVLVQTKTTIAQGSNTIIFEQTALLTQGFTYKPSSVLPAISKVFPEKIELNDETKLKDKTLISIEGSDFMVTKYIDPATNKQVQNYPMIFIQSQQAIGVPSTFLAKITKKTDGTIEVVDSTGATHTGLEFKVLDRNGKEVDGSVGNTKGERIVIFLPSGVDLKELGKRNIQVINPKIDMSGHGRSAVKRDCIEFITQSDNPIINKVVPNITALDGNDDIIVYGSNFQNGVSVYIDGVKVNSPVRTNDASGTGMTLKFKAPTLRREGATQILVQNPSGASASADFYYVASYNQNPKIKSVSPAFGSTNTLVSLRGENFLKSDSTVNSNAGLDVYKLLGTRVLIDGIDVNEYNLNTKNEIIYKAYTAPADDHVIKAYEKDGQLSMKLSDYAHSVVFENSSASVEEGKFYTISETKAGDIIFTNGKGKTYTLKVSGTAALPTYKAIDLSNTEHNVSFSTSGITIDSTDYTMSTPFKVSGEKIVGNKVRVHDAGRLEFVVPILNTGSGLKSITVVNPDTKSHTLEKCFNYFAAPATSPTITKIVPSKATVQGGVAVEIEGSGFSSGTRLYFDGFEADSTKLRVSFDGKKIYAIVPVYPDDITALYRVSELKVSVVVVNKDGGSATLKDGFTYVKPLSNPTISKLILDKGSANGGEVVEIIGDDFRYFEPYINKGGTNAYESEFDSYTNLNHYLNVNAKWDNLLAVDGRYAPSATDANVQIDLWEKESMPYGANYQGYDYYYKSPIIPRVFFGNAQAKVVEFRDGYLKVIAPKQDPGNVDVRVMNNDSATSNALKYTYEGTKPEITYIAPAEGNRIGSEIKTIVGKDLVNSTIFGYFKVDKSATEPFTYTEDPTEIVQNNRVQALVRFANITNIDIPVGQESDGRINAGFTTVKLEGGLKVELNTAQKELRVSVVEAGKTYVRLFTNYDGRDVFIPLGMLKDGTNYYKPVNHPYTDVTKYNPNNDYELIRVRMSDDNTRLFVERGYSQDVKFKSGGELELLSPSYYTIGVVDVTVINPDRSFAKTKFKYTNPMSRPIIDNVKPRKEIPAHSPENDTDKSIILAEGSIQGAMNIEITGRDFRENLKVKIGDKDAKVIDINLTAPDVQTVVVSVPVGKPEEVDKKFPIIVINEDGGLASSIDLKTIGNEQKLMYFVYRSNLSTPDIGEVKPNKTSQRGGNVITILGADFRAGLKVVLGSKGAIPITPTEIDRLGKYIKFVTPFNMSIGPKDIQIINEDFGFKEIKNGITIISNPIISKVETEKNPELGIVSVDGEDYVRFTGQNFMEGVKVYFGGSRILKSEKDTPAGGDVIGFYKDDNEYILRGAIEAPEVKFVNENTILVKTPKVDAQVDLSVVAINPDTGMSDSDFTVTFKLMIPTKPMNLKVTTVDDKYIKLYDYTSKNFKYYDVYVYMGEKSVYELVRNRYNDMQLLDTIDFEPYKITRLDGFEKLSKSDKISFAMKAVNEYGDSDWSNIVTIYYNDFSKIVAIGGSDQQGYGDFGLKPDTDIKQDLSGNSLTLQYPKGAYSAKPYLYFLSNNYRNVEKIDINMSKNVVFANDKIQSLQFDLFSANFAPSYFKSAKLEAMIMRDDQTLRFTIDYSGNPNKTSLLTKFPRNIKVLSPVIEIKSAIISNNSSVALDNPKTPVDMSINLNSRKVIASQNYNVYYFDNGIKSWIRIPATYDVGGKKLNFKADKLGFYVVAN